jgi:hypothetical protein
MTAQAAKAIAATAIRARGSTTDLHPGQISARAPIRCPPAVDCPINPSRDPILPAHTTTATSTWSAPQESSGATPASMQSSATAYSSLGLGLGLEVEDDGLAAEVGELDRIAILVGELEVGGGISWLDHRWIAPGAGSAYSSTSGRSPAGARTGRRQPTSAMATAGTSATTSSTSAHTNVDENALAKGPAMAA